MFIGPLLRGDFVLREEEDYPFSTITSKLMCAIILHLTMQPKIHEALERLSYIKRHPHRFERVTVPIVICYMKLIMEFLLEIISIIVTGVMAAPVNVAYDYVALLCIS